MIYNGSKIIGPVTHATIALQTEYDYIFDNTDFYTVLSSNDINGPFSLDIDIQNRAAHSLYFGIEIETDEGSETIADRRMLGFIPALSRLVIGSSSIPALASIRGNVSRIIVKLYLVTGWASDAESAIVYLRMSAPRDTASSLPFMADDLRAITLSGFYTHSIVNRTFTQVIGNHVLTTQWTYTVPAGRIAIVDYASLSLIESAAIPFANAAAILSINGVNELIRIVTLNAIGIRQEQLSASFEMRAPQSLIFQTINTSAINATYRGNAIIREYL